MAKAAAAPNAAPNAAQGNGPPDALSPEARSAMDALETAVANGSSVPGASMAPLVSALSTLAPDPRRINLVQCTPGQAADAWFNGKRIMLGDELIKAPTDTSSGLALTVYSNGEYRREVGQ